MLPTTTSSNNNNNNNSNEPPQPNPILTAYEGWYHSTPFVTRSILSIQVISYLISWFIDPNFALANIPHFVITRYEVYRLVLSPLVNTSFISLIFAYLSFNEQGKRLEYSMGSTRFAALCLSIGTITNIAFFTLSIIIFYINGGGPDQVHILLSSSASGIWLILFGIIAMECVQAPTGTQRKLFLFQIPVLYYPIALLIFFAFISASFSLAYCLSIAIGYLYGFGYLDRIQLSHGKATEWEDGSATNTAASSSSSSSSSSSFNWAGYLTRRDGWVSCHAATGSDAWMDSASMGGAGMTMPLFRTPGTSNVSSITGATAAAARSSGGGGGSNVSSFAASSMSAGRTLGRGGGESTITGAATTGGTGASISSSSTTRRPGHHTAADARSARLQALEQRRSHYPDAGGGGGSSGGGGTQQQSTTGL